MDVFDETSFSLVGSIPVNDLGTSGYSTNFRKIVRWGQNGIAVAAVPSAFTSNNQIYIFQSPLVKDISSSPSDLSVSLTAPATATAGTVVSYSAKVTNIGPNAAVGATLSASLAPSLHHQQSSRRARAYAPPRPRLRVILRAHQPERRRYCDRERHADHFRDTLGYSVCLFLQLRPHAVE